MSRDASRTRGAARRGCASGRHSVSRHRYVSRRAFLGSAAAVAAASGLPLMESLRPAHAATAYPKRFVFMYNPNGTIQDEFWPSVGSGETDFTLPRITSPLEPHKSKLLFLDGVNLSVTQTGPGGPHQRGIGSLLTGRELQKGDFVGGDGSLAGWANGISIDQTLAQSLGQDNLLPSLELGVRAMDAEVRTRISYAGPANPLPPVNSPLAAYQRVFSGVTAFAPELTERRQQVADTLHQLYGELRPRLSQVDQSKADAHLDLIRGIERRLGVSVDATNCATPDAPPDLAEDDEQTMQAVSDLQVDLIVAALSCDITRISTLQFSSAVNAIGLPWIEYTDSSGNLQSSDGSGHSLSHAGDSDEDAREQLILRSQWYAGRFARLIAGLDAIQEGEGTLLDNSVVLWGNELGIGNSHNLDNVPFVLAGGAGGYFRPGRAMSFGGRAHNGLLVSILQAMGLDVTEYGHPDFNDGPLSDMT